MNWGSLGAALARAVFSSPKRKRPQAPPSLWGASLSYANQGRGGHVYFSQAGQQFGMYYEFGGSKALVLITIPTPENWVAETGIALERRDEVLHFIARQVIFDQTLSGQNGYELSPDCITILEA